MWVLFGSSSMIRSVSSLGIVKIVKILFSHVDEYMIKTHLYGDNGSDSVCVYHFLKINAF